MKKIKKTIYNIDSEKKINVKIVHISDLHFFKEKDIVLLNRILVRIKDINPDFICITGDFLDDDISNVSLFLSWLKELGNIAKVILCIGNHDVGNVHFYHRNVRKNFDLIRKIDNVILLDNQKWEKDTICFIGITVPYEAYLENEKAINVMKEYLDKLKLKCSPHHFNVVLIHTPYLVVHPNIFNYPILKNSDLILSGHTHGGMTPKWLYHLLGKRAFFSPAKHIFPQYSQGYYPNYHLIINSAIKKLSDSSKLEFFDKFTSSEIIEINIKGMK